jgi:hypothetical protein
MPAYPSLNSRSSAGCRYHKPSEATSIVGPVVGFKGCGATVALAFAGVYLTGFYGKVTLKYTRWTLNNDFRDGCINDLDHNLTLAEECSAELARPRVSAVNMKRQLEALEDAFVDSALYWAVAVCIPVLTCVFYLVWMRRFTRDGPRPVVSLVKMDFNNCGQDRYPTMTQNDEDLYDPSHIREHKNFDNLQQAAIDASPSDPGSNEDYFQAWRDRMRSVREDVPYGESDTESTHSDLSQQQHFTRRISITSSYKARMAKYTGSTAALWSGSGRNSPIIPDSRRESVFETPAPLFEVFEAEFKPSGNRVKCQQIELDVHISEFRPTDGILLEVCQPTLHRAETMLQVPFEREATALELVQAGTQRWPLKFPKRATWARRLGLPTPRFVYILVKKEDTLLLGSLARRKAL